MDVLLERFLYHPKGTLGSLTVEGERFYSVERPWQNNAPNVSCIPEGDYLVVWRTSPKFGLTWHITDVPERTHILIHVANFPEDVQGCIGLGTDLMGDKVAVSSSRVAVERFEELTKGEEEWQIKIVHAAFAGL